VTGHGGTIPDPGFAGDSGDVDESLAAALSSYASGAGSQQDVIAALAATRLLVPVVAVLGEEADVAPGELRREKSADMALPTLLGADGRRALPAFTSLATLAAWQADARPVPVETRRAALSAVGEGCDVMVVDVASATPYVVSRPQLWALAEGRDWVPAYADPQVRAAVAAAVDGEPDISGAEVAAGGDGQPEVVVTLALRPVAGAEGAPKDLPDAHRDVLRRVAERLAADPVVRARTSGGVGIAVLPPGG
jgi:hypothetical protein